MYIRVSILKEKEELWNSKIESTSIMSTEEKLSYLTWNLPPYAIPKNY